MENSMQTTKALRKLLINAMDGKLPILKFEGDGLSLEEQGFNEWVHGASMFSELNFDGSAWVMLDAECLERRAAKTVFFAYLVYVMETEDANMQFFAEYKPTFIREAHKLNEYFSPEDKCLLCAVLGLLLGNLEFRYLQEDMLGILKTACLNESLAY